MADPQQMTESVSRQYQDSRNLDARIRLHQLFSTNPYGWYRWYLDQLDLPVNSHILELGCGPAALWKDNLQRIAPGWRLVLSDFSFGMIGKARQNTANQMLYSNADAQAIPFESGRFDAVLANHMLYHVPDQQRAIAEIRRVLKPGGKLYAATNGEGHMTDMDALVERLAPELSIRANAPQVDSWRVAFTLENGQVRLARCFETVRIERYIDDLVIREAQPFIDYVLSMQVNYQHPIADESIARLKSGLENEILRYGAIRIHKDAGLFIAQ